jgi:hypothetical protein
LKFLIITNHPTRVRVRDEKEKLFDKVKRMHITSVDSEVSVFGFYLLERR